MKRFLSLGLAVATLLLCLSGCRKEFNPASKKDFAGTTWVANSDGVKWTLSFMKDDVAEFRADLSPTSHYIYSGGYDFYPETGKVQMVFDTVKEEFHISVQFESLVYGVGQLLSDKNKMKYEDNKGLSLEFTKQ